MATVLLVDDEPSILHMYEAKFIQTGFSVLVASNGKDALRLAETKRPDLVLLDLRMPHMNGDEVLAHIREADWGSNMYVAILTNLSRSEAPAALQFLGVSRYVVKAHHTPAQVVEIAKEILHIS